MRRVLTCIVVIFAAFAAAGSGDNYLKLRKQYGITQAVSVAALETLVGTRTVEVKGVVKGMMKTAQGASLLLEKSDGDFLFVSTTEEIDWLSGNEVPVRLLVNATRTEENAELKATLLDAAPESRVAAYEAAAAAAAAPKPLASRGGAVRSKGTWNVAANQAVPIYASFIRNRNKRLTPAEASQIAQGVIGFSLQYGVDARLIMAMLMVESGFNPKATSRSGAMGLGQLMPGTARGMGVSNAYDTMQNLYGTVRLIRGHLDKYQKSAAFDQLALALAAYNAGPGAVRMHGGVPPYRETQNYVVKVTSIYQALMG